MTINRLNYFKGRDKSKDFKPEYEQNSAELIKKVNKFFQNYKKDLTITSGYRPASANQSAGGAIKSNHLICRAIDILDMDLSVWRYCLENLQLAKDIGLWFEDKRWTSSWVHLQDLPPKSGKRIYIPNSSPPERKDIWDGNYDKKFD